VEEERRSLIIENRGAAKAVLLSIHDYERRAAPEPEVNLIVSFIFRKSEIPEAEPEALAPTMLHYSRTPP